MPTQSAISTAGLTKHYDKVQAVTDLSLDVPTGSIYGFLGPNGAGKSTTIRLLLGFLHPTAGSATVLGHDIGHGSVEIRRRVGYLPGGIAFWDGLTGERLLDDLAALSGRPPVRRDELLDRLEMSGRTLQRQVRDYSRGMRQKLGIVQALQHDPELAILDEPTEGLDPLMQRDDGRTIFFSSHILSEVERVCDRVAIVRHGRLVALEDVATLIARRKRTAEIRFEGAPPRLAGVPGVSDVAMVDHLVTCRLDGDVGPFLDALRDVTVRDLAITPASLEEAFLEFYEDDEPTEPADPTVMGPAS
jgi:ABC-2 type transport system ATP-binding protein